MLSSLALDGFWLIGALLAVYVTGVFTSQWAKDKLSGIPAELRAGLKTQETAALAAVKAAQTKVIADVTGLLTKTPVAAAVAVKVPAVAIPLPVAAVIDAAKPAV